MGLDTTYIPRQNFEFKNLKFLFDFVIRTSENGSNIPITFLEARVKFSSHKLLKIS